jgi:hydroxypyruvate isomerase
MLRFAANISTLFTELPLLERPAAAAKAGFSAIEMQFPYVVAREDIAAARAAADVEFVLINMPAGDLAAGELGLACLPSREAGFAEAVEQAIVYAQALGCQRANCLAGNLPRGESHAHCWNVLVKNIEFAAEKFAAAKIQLLVEVLNNVDFPNFILGKISDGDALLATVKHPNLALQYDVYHRRAAGDDWFEGLEPRLDRIGHIQFSDYPGRHEPGTGELDMRKLFASIERLPYAGWTGAEYKPFATTIESFAWREWIINGDYVASSP